MEVEAVREALGAGPPSGTFPIVIFIPSVDKDGAEIDQQGWRDRALDELARIFRGATALPPGRGAWRADDGSIILEDTAVVFSVTDPNDVTAANLQALGRFARVLGRDANQGEVGLIVGGRYHPITDFE
jgi:hypothetical protein